MTTARGAAQGVAPVRQSGIARWWTYQRERFPLAMHAPLIAAFTSSGLCLSALLRGGTAPRWPVVAAAFATGLAFFLQLRIADEFKDAADDARFRPYRPVPRGLVTLRELAWVGAACAAGQLALALLVDVRLVALLVPVWGFMAAMSLDFGARAWLVRHPLVVLASHMLVLPLFDLYATAFDWLPAGVPVARGIGWFMAASYGTGVVVELGRKLRAPPDEETGVETYSARFGLRTASIGMLVAMALTLGCAVQVSRLTGHVRLAALPLCLILLVTAFTAWRVVRAPRPGDGRRFEMLAGVWTLVLYLAIGIVPYALVHSGWSS